MSRRVILIGLAGALAVVVALAVWFSINPPTPQEEEAVETEDDQRVEISRLELEQIQEMLVESPNGRLRIYRDGEDWKVDHPYQVPLDASAVDDLTYSFGRLYSERVIEESPEDLAVYGLDPPVATARVTLADGEQRTFYLGSRTPARNTYYLRQADDPTVYAVWMNHGEHFQWVLDDIRERDIPPVNSQEITWFRLLRKDAPDIELKAVQEKDEEEVRFNLGYFQMTRPYSEPYGVDTEEMTEYFGSFPTFQIEEFIADNVTDFSPYGLAEPDYDFYVADKETSIHLQFGKPKDERLIYFKRADGTSVYTMRRDRLEFLQEDPFELVDKFAFIVNIDFVEEVAVKAPDAGVTLSLTRTGEGDDVETTYLADGQEVEEDPFKKLYQSFIGMFIEAENKTPRGAAPEVTLTYKLNKGRIKSWTIEYSPYDADFYEVAINGKAEFLISAEQIRNLVADVKKYRAEQL